MVEIGQHFAKCTIIGYRNTGENFELDRNGESTGFFFQDEIHGYLVTNEHNVLDDNEVPIDIITIRVHQSGDPGEVTTKDIELLDNDKPRWLTHPDADIALIPLQFDLENIFNMAFTYHDILPRNARHDGKPIVGGGNSCIIVGFPLGFTDEHWLPVIRNGLISSEFGLDFERSPCFLVDAQVQDGLSGSPVLKSVRLGTSFKGEKLHPDNDAPTGNTRIGRSKSYLLGVLSESVYPMKENRRKQWMTDIPDGQSEVVRELRDRIEDLEDQLENQIELHRVYYADLIYMILKENR